MKEKTKAADKDFIVASDADKKKEKAQKKSKKDKKPGFFARLGGKFKDVFSELKKVTWPSFKKTMKQTGMVISVVALFMLVTLGIDSLLNWILKLISNI